MKVILITACCLTISLLLSAQQPGSLDYSFGEGGKVISKNFGNCYSMALQHDSKVVCGGALFNIDTGFRLVRYLISGNIDTSFGKQGIADITFSETSYAMGGIKIQDDQKIVIGGWGYKNGIPTFVVARCLPDGSLDESFGRNGIADTSIGIGESASAVGIQPDGKILVSGWYYPSSYITLRYNTNGSLDKSFGNGGVVFTDFGTLDTEPRCISVLPDNKILIGGDGGYNPLNFLLLRYLPDGSLDNSFGNKGKTVTDFGPGGDYLTAMALQSDGKIVVTGTSNYNNSDNMALARYESNGILDTSFGQAGKVTCKFIGLYSKASGVLVQNDGKIIINGWTFDDVDANFAMVRYLSNGAPDSSFGNSSQVITDFGLADDSYASALQNDGKIILAGTSFIYDPKPQNNFALARYYGDGNKKQNIVVKIKRWLQHGNGIMWNTISGVSSYAVQRSADAVSWSAVRTERLAVNSRQPAAGYYEDALPLSGDNYYRLQTTGTSGAVAYSNVISVRNASASGIKVYPNPIKNTLHIEGLSAGAPAGLSIINFNGNVAATKRVIAESCDWNVQQLGPGNYLLRISQNHTITALNFIKE